MSKGRKSPLPAKTSLEHLGVVIIIIARVIFRCWGGCKRHIGDGEWGPRGICCSLELLESLSPKLLGRESFLSNSLSDMGDYGVLTLSSLDLVVSSPDSMSWLEVALVLG